MLLVIKINVFQGTVVNLLVDSVHKFELISLKLVACQRVYNLIVSDKVINFLSHSHVALDKV